jgi:putative tricarboxylic transport membrane protein
MSATDRWRIRGARGRAAGLPALLGVLLLGIVACEPEDVAPAPDPDDPDVAEEPEWFPEQEVTMVVPFAAGGGSDLLGRAVVAGIEEIEPDINFVVENREGGSGAVGYGYFMEQTGNPHFLLPAEVTRSMLPATQDVPFDYDTWTDIGMFAEDVGFLVVHADSEWEDIEQFIADAGEAAEAGQPLRVGVPSAGGVDELTVFQLAEEAGVDFERVVYDGTGETNPALLAGDIDATVVNPSDGRDELEAEQFRALLGFGAERLDDPILGDVPMAPEHDWDVVATKYRGVIAPPDIPDEAREFWTGVLEQFPETDAYADYMTDAMLAENFQWGEDWVQWLEGEWHPAVMDDLARMVEG